MHINELLKIVVEKNASDLHLRVGSPPMVRIFGKLSAIENCPSLTIEDSEAIFASITTPAQKTIFAENLELDCAYSAQGIGRFRVNVLRQRGTIAFAIRLVPFVIPTIDNMKLPQICKQLILKPRGLILVARFAGSGKSTTMAAMIDHLNETESRNIITVEDPIEYLHRNKKCIIAQRDLGDDTKSFEMALLHTLRQDPDVIYIGELRDLITISMALRAAETGHLVLGTLHTTSASQTIDRIIDIFPANQQEQIKVPLLSQVLEAVLMQCLLPRLHSEGRIAAFEIMLATSGVRNLIRQVSNKIVPMPYAVDTGVMVVDKSGLAAFKTK